MLGMTTKLDKSKKLRRRESWKQKAQRLAVCTRTLDRWVADGIISKPIVVKGRKYGFADEMPRPDAV
jgi:hypothetical protein